MLIWGAVTFGVAFYARELSRIDFFGWPLPFWVGAQGALIAYVIIIVVYARVMNRADDILLEASSADSQTGESPGPVQDGPSR